MLYCLPWYPSARALECLSVLGILCLYAELDYSDMSFRSCLLSCIVNTKLFVKRASPSRRQCVLRGSPEPRDTITHRVYRKYSGPEMRERERSSVTTETPGQAHGGAKSRDDRHMLGLYAALEARRSTCRGTKSGIELHIGRHSQGRAGQGRASEPKKRAEGGRRRRKRRRAKRVLPHPPKSPLQCPSSESISPRYVPRSETRLLGNSLS